MHCSVVRMKVEDERANVGRIDDAEPPKESRVDRMRRDQFVLTEG